MPDPVPIAAEPVDEFLEREAGSRTLRAVLLADLGSTCEAAYEELRYDRETPDDVIAALKLLKDHDFRV